MKAPRLLVALLEGVGREDIDDSLTPFLAEYRSEHGSAPLHRASIAEPALELLASDLVGGLRNLGLQVEQRSIVLRPDWRGDGAAIRQLALRPLGPPEVVFLRFADAAAIAARHGARSAAHLRALTDLDDLLARAAQLLEVEGAPPQLVLLCMGPMLPTVRTFDPVACLGAMMPGLLRRQLRWKRLPGGLLVRCGSTQAEAHLRELVKGPPFCGHGATVDDDLAGRLLLPGELLLLPREGVAFGAAPIAAVLPYLPRGDAADGIAMLPWPERGNNAAPIPEVAAHILMHGAVMAELRGVDRISGAPSAPAPDVETPLEHHPLHMIED